MNGFYAPNWVNWVPVNSQYYYHLFTVTRLSPPVRIFSSFARHIIISFKITEFCDTKKADSLFLCLLLWSCSRVTAYLQSLFYIAWFLNTSIYFWITPWQTLIYICITSSTINWEGKNKKKWEEQGEDRNKTPKQIPPVPAGFHETHWFLPPWTYYPDCEGSHEWIHPQVL